MAVHNFDVKVVITLRFPGTLQTQSRKVIIIVRNLVLGRNQPFPSLFASLLSTPSPPFSPPLSTLFFQTLESNPQKTFFSVLFQWPYVIKKLTIFLKKLCYFKKNNFSTFLKLLWCVFAVFNVISSNSMHIVYMIPDLWIMWIPKDTIQCRYLINHSLWNFARHIRTCTQLKMTHRVTGFKGNSY